MQRALLSLLYMKQTNRWLFDSLCLCNQHLANLRRLLGWKSCDFICVHSSSNITEAVGGNNSPSRSDCLMILLVKNYSSLSETLHTGWYILSLTSRYVLTLSGSLCVNELTTMQMCKGSVAVDLCALYIYFHLKTVEE